MPSSKQKDNLSCPCCGAKYLDDPHAKLSAATTVKLANNNPARFQTRCRKCGARGPKKDSRSSARDEWAKLRSINKIE